MKRHQSGNLECVRRQGLSYHSTGHSRRTAIPPLCDAPQDPPASHQQRGLRHPHSKAQAPRSISDLLPQAGRTRIRPRHAELARHRPATCQDHGTWDNSHVSMTDLVKTISWLEGSRCSGGPPGKCAGPADHGVHGCRSGWLSGVHTPRPRQLARSPTGRAHGSRTASLRKASGMTASDCATIVTYRYDHPPASAPGLTRRSRSSGTARLPCADQLFGMLRGAGCVFGSSLCDAEVPPRNIMTPFANPKSNGFADINAPSFSCPFEQ